MGTETPGVDTTNLFKIEDGTMLSGANMDGLAVSDQRQLWLRLDTPSDTTVSAAQEIQVTVTAVTGVTN